eukprot:gene12737-12833_t
MKDLAEISSKIILPYFRTNTLADDKSQGAIFDPVTDADRNSEFEMRDRIKQRFPGHGLIGEEYGMENETAEFVWVLDPIDGTKSFISGSPLWGTLVGLMQSGKPVLGMMNQPFTREMFLGDGKSATWTGFEGISRPLQVRPCAELSQATLLTTSPLLIAPQLRTAYTRVEQHIRLPRYGGDCYAYCQLAMGQADLVIEAGLKPHDIVALIPIIEGAGGIITTWDGGDAAKGGAILAAGDPRVHAQALELLNA